ncbi:DUF3696 domain-containing protein [Bacteroidales bacterium OttesenSCG-928-B11]|nr:DUF3696 domain-containing protein [Bacteroidales bacterium OttesenSCG-928-B11]MDL2326473.1 DUF3696 domain-containing protein [Bacteroidales bacterium OttesenSCG-928-A14]
MIRKIEIENFKSHKATQLDFSNLTVLCGTNSSGKSSVIQVLLLLREAERVNFEYFNLLSNTVKIKSAKNALYQFAKEDKITIIVNTDKQNLFFGSTIHDLTKTVLPIVQDNREIDKTDPLFENSCQFISAFRLGPQDSYKKDDRMDFDNQISFEEGKSERVVQFLNKHRNNTVFSELCIPNHTNDLFSQVTAWEREISSGVNVVVQDNGTFGYELKYQFNTETSLGRTDEIDAVNVGFGLTYALPVIVAILSAPKDAIIFIENPEAHLHPKGQAKLAELICLAAQAGVQIVIETHSDHIFNGIRKSINKKVISRKKAKVHFFELDENSTTVSTEINFSDNGRILEYKKGLFDQFDNDLDELLGL